VPSVKPHGVYTIELSLNTRSALGTLTSKRDFSPEDPIYNTASNDYFQARQKNDKAKMAKARSQLLAGWFKDHIKPGAAVSVDKPLGSARTDTSKVSAVLMWIPKANYLEVKADVTDAYMKTDAPADTPWLASSIELFISPSGMSSEINHFAIVPSGANGQTSLLTISNNKAAPLAPKANWKKTAKGYALDVRIPWNLVNGYEKGWKLMPVEALVNSKTPNGYVQILMNKAGYAVNMTKNYAGLLPK